MLRSPFLVLMDPSWYWQESAVFDKLVHQNGAWKYLHFLKCMRLHSIWDFLITGYTLMTVLQCRCHWIKKCYKIHKNVRSLTPCVISPPPPLFGCAYPASYSAPNNISTKRVQWYTTISSYLHGIISDKSTTKTVSLMPCRVSLQTIGWN